MNNDNVDFWKALGGKGKIKTAAEGRLLPTPPTPSTPSAPSLPSSFNDSQSLPNSSPIFSLRIPSPSYASQGGVDTEADAGKLASTAHKKVMRVSDASGQVKFEKVAEGKFGRNVLKSEDVFVVDGGFEIFVWIGRGSTTQVPALTLSSLSRR